MDSCCATLRANTHLANPSKCGTDTTTHFDIMTSRSFRGSESLQGKSIPMSVKFARRTSSGRYDDYSGESNDLDSDISSGEIGSGEIGSGEFMK
ncbi:hypothetical protein LOK49_LG02G01264 [Camellia lanceoleosa]|uniref:Uncharacterized protein n=1 Tax=Camellia lanceoleosa TaxID=1840588 RepID=A0ACC0ILT1_9ERIC|nr:hypothetical protein LOK49_LG02G01264 [Camellia lanceoleosa]